MRIGLPSPATGLALALLALAPFGCKKGEEQPEAPGPTVIVEEPDSGTPTVPAAETSTGGEQLPFGSLETVATDVPCKSDADCVKSPCCHPTTCVAVADAPDCSATICTMDCRAGTMDCNGGCVCQEGRCAAQLWSPPAEPVE